VDDRKREGDDAGAANMGHAEFNAACYYRYLSLNLDLLANEDHLKGIGKAGRQKVVSAFLRAALLAVPSAKKTSKNGDCFPEFALGLVSSGQPFQLANAFESPVRANGHGWLAPSVDALEKHYTKLKKIFGLQNLIREEVRLSEESPLDTFIEKIVAHVH
jgi:CRISPR system Cascade subunit CasC